MKCVFPSKRFNAAFSLVQREKSVPTRKPLPACKRFDFIKVWLNILNIFECHTVPVSFKNGQYSVRRNCPQIYAKVETK